MFTTRTKTQTAKFKLRIFNFLIDNGYLNFFSNISIHIHACVDLEGLFERDVTCT
jgi:hypothetical protein